MTNLNPLLENLQERTVQQAPIKLIHAENIYRVFDKGTSEFYGAEDEYTGDQPLEGVIWAKSLKSKDLENLPPVFSCKLPIIHNKVYYTIYNKKVMKRALQGPEQMAILTDRLIDSMKSKAVVDVNQKITEIICNTDNYRNTAITEITAEEANIDSIDKAIAILKMIGKARENMLEPSTEYNKGYRIPGSQVWNQVITNSKSRNSLILTIDPEFLQDIELRFLSGVNNDASINPYKTFKEVIKKKLTGNVKATIHDEEGVVYRIINDDGITEEKVFGSGNTKFGYHLEVIGGMIPFKNAWALLVK